MKRTRILGLCLVAVFALAAFASSASALQYFHGKKATELVPLAPGAKLAYKLKGKEALLKGGATITCASNKGSGELEGPDKTNNIHIEYKKCVAPGAGNVSCQSGTGKGIIKTEELQGVLTEASETKGGPTVKANKLTPGPGASKNGKGEAQFAVFTCGAAQELKVNVTGTILVKNEPQTGATKKPSAVNAEKASETEFGCGKQALLYTGGACEHLLTPGGTSWNVAVAAETFKEFIEVK
jgi:hypothetical protein